MDYRIGSYHNVKPQRRAPRMFAPIGENQGVPECAQCGVELRQWPAGGVFFKEKRVCEACFTKHVDDEPLAKIGLPKIEDIKPGDRITLLPFTEADAKRLGVPVWVGETCSVWDVKLKYTVLKEVIVGGSALCWMLKETDQWYPKEFCRKVVK